MISQCNDTFTLIKVGGEQVHNIKGLYTGKVIYIPGSSPLIESKDLLRREMSNGGIETYQVVDPCYFDVMDHEPHYQIKYRKLGLPEAEKAVNSITYNISGPNTRVNNNSVDNSTNTVNINPEISEHIAILKNEIERLVENESEKKDALEIVDAIDVQFKSEQPSRPVVGTLLKALPDAASIASIGSFLMSCL